MSWSAVLSILIFGTLKAFKVFRVTKDIELKGILVNYSSYKSNLSI